MKTILATLIAAVLTLCAAVWPPNPTAENKRRCGGRKRRCRNTRP